MMNKLIIALAMVSAATAAPSLARRDACQDEYQACIASGTTPTVTCDCKLTACVGEDNERARAACAAATSSQLPSGSGMPGIPGGCNPAHMGSCPPLPPPQPVIPSATASATSTPTPTSPPDSGNPDPDPMEMWTIKNLVRYCSQANDGCDYNFAIEADGKSENCTVIRFPHANATTESWDNQPCTTGSDYTVSWDFAADPAPASALLTVAKDDMIAMFGINDVNGKPVTPSNPLGSGQFGDIGPVPVQELINVIIIGDNTK
ncbi:hypothetical protein LY78DRAFT_713642 [Colletotrichum sublineola]|uniref:Uncharacterized protein n=1 Tax=Colletotrichum sublineola TaxID=1173701 RepID=A0A066XAD1_COLSU|nr:hypothetical protein LY78DRAFT_713642 [Colletotrichum sublineola]KDN62671.1 hypothetical protein CSUB01_11861 [Colletotrichum sublineola]